MSTNDPSAMPPSGAPSGAAAPGQPSEEELRAAYEAELSRITSAELMLQAAVSLLNVGSFRLAPRAPAPGAGAEPAQSAAPQPPSGADLEQARDAIDAVRALLEIIERRMPNETAPLRNALSQLQMVYAREAQAAGATAPTVGDAGQGAGEPPSGGPAGGAPGGAPGAGEGSGEQTPGPGPAESSGRLWVPGR
ncbi:MAG TPA: hypothetical protein VK761_11890 [Solirubrobacteraceae bacterium]|jgi:hypothetical protein|nr:hypothetical protein [Solirubrobacteraceae bacterium]